MPINKAAIDQASAARKKYRADTPISLQSIEGEDMVFIAAYSEAVRAAGDAQSVELPVASMNCPICGLDSPHNHANFIDAYALLAKLDKERFKHHTETGNRFPSDVYIDVMFIIRSMVNATKQESYAAPSPICPRCQQNGKGGCDEYHCEVPAAGQPDTSPLCSFNGTPATAKEVAALFTHQPDETRDASLTALEALTFLVAMKAHKDQFGKTPYYKMWQPRAWERAITALGNESMRQPARESGSRFLEPFLSNRADGVDGHYCIARKSPKGDYYEYWNSGKWRAYGQVFNLNEIEGQS